MSSARFPGKMLAPLRGLPVISHVITRVSMALPKERIVVVTSAEASDDPLALYVQEALGIAVFRGELDNVVGRFQACLRQFPCEWFVRICGDSPVLDPLLLASLLAYAENEGRADLVTNVQRRTFPPGQSVEVVRAHRFLALNPGRLETDEKEHVTLHYYRHPEAFRIQGFVSNNPDIKDYRLVVDTLADLLHIEEILREKPDQVNGYADYLEKDTA